MLLSDEAPENRILSEEWKIMSLNKLYDQKRILGNRISASIGLQNEVIYNQLQRGMEQIEYYIQLKHLNIEDNKANRTLIT